MKRIALIIGTGVMSSALLGCGDDHRMGGGPPPPPPPPPSMTKDLDTAAVLAIVQTQTSETADPFEVDNAAIAVTPIGDETSSPLSVDAT
ncbi:MAG TPA: hypothetical protein VK743_06475 [Steroidobacteraceae bacterium]|jgi:hypothetical protein|nr:hypothetical protein [Steroidobacteraceae bacterium]